MKFGMNIGLAGRIYGNNSDKVPFLYKQDTMSLYTMSLTEHFTI